MSNKFLPGQEQNISLWKEFMMIEYLWDSHILIKGNLNYNMAFAVLEDHFATW